MIDEKFYERMMRLLGEDYEAFLSSLEEPPVRAVRVNEEKISVDGYLSKTALSLSKIPYVSNGFIPDGADGIGNTPEHHSGMIYVQDGGAMATVSALDIKRGWRVLDSCAAPGGKATQIASCIGREGFILANEYVPKRAKIMLGNFERMGIRNGVITSLDTAELAGMFSSYFDLVLCDAPCSGEGMFRKSSEAVMQWSEENVIACAKRQEEILNNVARTVRGGGYLLYSTCTYSVEENEETVARFLKNHPDFKLCKVKDRLARCTAGGIAVEGLSPDDAEKCRRFYPHIEKGEGQFIALMQRDEDAPTPEVLFKESIAQPTKSEAAIVEKFFKENMKEIPKGRLIKQGGGIAIVPSGIPIPQKSTFMAGVMVGEIKGSLLVPHHQFFSAYGSDMKNTENLTRSDSRISAYLRGEEIEAKEAEGGFCTVMYEGAALGGGKVSGGRIKNHYPKGLRNK